MPTDPEPYPGYHQDLAAARLLLERRYLFAPEAAQLRALAARLGLELQIQRYDLNPKSPHWLEWHDVE